MIFGFFVGIPLVIYIGIAAKRIPGFTFLGAASYLPGLVLFKVKKFLAFRLVQECVYLCSMFYYCNNAGPDSNVHTYFIVGMMIALLIFNKNEKIYGCPIGFIFVLLNYALLMQAIWFRIEINPAWDQTGICTLSASIFLLFPCFANAR